LAYVCGNFHDNSVFANIFVTKIFVFAKICERQEQMRKAIWKNLAFLTEN